jgi:hypothetical protein
VSKGVNPLPRDPFTLLKAHLDGPAVVLLFLGVKQSSLTQ